MTTHRAGGYGNRRLSFRQSLRDPFASVHETGLKHDRPRAHALCSHSSDMAVVRELRSAPRNPGLSTRGLFSSHLVCVRSRAVGFARRSIWLLRPP